MQYNDEKNNKKDYRRKLTPRALLSGISELEQEFQQEAETGKVKYGVEILDDYVGSIRKGSITFIVARPNTGKSLLSQKLATNLAKQGHKVLICSCEMGASMLIERQLVNIAGVNRDQLYDLYTTRKDTALRIMNSIMEQQLYSYMNNISIVETAGATASDIVEMLRVYNEFEYVIIDYLQRIRGVGSEYEVLSAASAEFQQWARETKKSLILCSQAKRAGGDARNNDSQGKGTGSIEEDGDVGLLLSEGEMLDGKRTIVFTLTKNRYGYGKGLSYLYTLDHRLNLNLISKG